MTPPSTTSTPSAVAEAAATAANAEIAATPAKSPRQPAPEPSAPIRGYYESCSVASSRKGAVPAWVRWHMFYTIAKGPQREVTTFSHRLGKIIGSLEEGAEILITTVPDRPPHGEKLVTLELISPVTDH